MNRPQDFDYSPAGAGFAPPVAVFARSSDGLGRARATLEAAGTSTGPLDPDRPRPPVWVELDAAPDAIEEQLVARLDRLAREEGLSAVVAALGRGQPIHILVYVALIVFFAFFYTAVVFNPKDTADNLRKHGGFLPGIRPGEKTAEYIDYVLTRITVVGAIYLAAVCVLPEILTSYAAVPFYFGGTSLLIAVSVTMDTVAQIQSHLLAHQYEGLIKKAKLRGATSRGGRR